jgi:hypothetical protein
MCSSLRVWSIARYETRTSQGSQILSVSRLPRCSEQLLQMTWACELCERSIQRLRLSTSVSLAGIRFVSNAWVTMPVMKPFADHHTHTKPSLVRRLIDSEETSVKSCPRPQSQVASYRKCRVSSNLLFPSWQRRYQTLPCSRQSVLTSKHSNLKLPVKRRCLTQ